MTIETEVAALTAATTSLLGAVNVSKATLDASKDTAVASAAAALTSQDVATAQAATATTKATEAAASAILADTSRAAAVAAQNNAVATVTGGTASLVAANSRIPISDAEAQVDPSWLENNQTFQRLVGAIAYATDLAGHAAGSPLVLDPGTPSGTTVGNPGNVDFDTNFLYICVAKNVWKRVALASF